MVFEQWSKKARWRRRLENATMNAKYSELVKFFLELCYHQIGWAADGYRPYGFSAAIVNRRQCKPCRAKRIAYLGERGGGAWGGVGDITTEVATLLNNVETRLSAKVPWHSLNHFCPIYTILSLRQLNFQRSQVVRQCLSKLPRLVDRVAKFAMAATIKSI